MRKKQETALIQRNYFFPGTVIIANSIELILLVSFQRESVVNLVAEKTGYVG